MCKVSQQDELFRREIQGNAAALGALMAGVDLQIVNAKFVPTTRCSTQKRTYAGKQFRKREWFYDVIVRTELEALHAVAHAIARRQKNNRDLFLGRAQFFHQGPAIFFWKHDIDDEKIELARARRGQPGLAIEGEIDDETGFAQAFCQKGSRLLFVFNHQNSHKIN